MSYQTSCTYSETLGGSNPWQMRRILGRCRVLSQSTTVPQKPPSENTRSSSPWIRAAHGGIWGMAKLSFILGVIGNVLSILVFASPVTTFWRIVKNKSTENFKGLPYVCTLLSTSLWTYYGLIKPGGLLITTVNGAGAALEAIFVTLYLIYAPRETKVKTARLVVLLNVAFLGSVFLVTFLAVHGKLRINVVGALCAGLTLGMYGSPMAAMRTVIVTKSVEFMPFFLSFFLFLNGGAWSTYAVLVRDFYVGIPNGLGFVLGAAQLVLYMIYRKGKPSNEQEEGDDRKEAGTVDVEMAGRAELDGMKTSFNNGLQKESILPEQPLVKQNRLQNIVKTVPIELENVSPDCEKPSHHHRQGFEATEDENTEDRREY